MFIKGFDARFFEGKPEEDPYSVYKVNLTYNLPMTKFKLPRFINMDNQTMNTVKKLVKRDDDLRATRINTEVE